MVPRELWIAVVALSAACQPSTGRFMAGDSMLPTYPVGAELVVRKSAPARGDVVVFRSAEDPRREYFKRVIGITGDTVSMNGAEVVLNGKPIARCRVGPWGYAEPDGKRRFGEMWLESFEGARWLVFHDAAGAYAPSSGPWTVAPGEVFVLGDNRENSFDSRMWKAGSGLPLSLVLGTITSAPPLTECEHAASEAPGKE